MAHFVTFDDGVSYISTSLIRSFEIEDDENGGRITVFKLHDGSSQRTSRPISEVAEMLDAVNVWY